MAMGFSRSTLDRYNYQVGDVWARRDSRLVTVIAVDDKYVTVTHNGTDYAVMIEGGRWMHTTESDEDVVTFVSRLPVTEPTKLTNPKEAMGDKKVPLWLCSTIAMAHWAAAQVAGLLKYGAWNWRAAGVRASTYISAINRHLGRYANGERCDPVDGTHHLGNIMACCAILLEAEAIGKLNDDRAPSADLQATFDEVEGIIARLKEQYKDKAPKHWTIEDQI